MRPGMEEPEQAEDRYGGKPAVQRETVMRSEIEVAKSRKGPSRKAAIVYILPVP